MMMIRNGTAAAAQGGGTGLLFPADRCTFQIINDPNGTGYLVHAAFDDAAVRAGNDANHPMFYPGNEDAIPLSSVAAGRPQLGYIGKSGRFVATTN